MNTKLRLFLPIILIFFLFFFISCEKSKEKSISAPKIEFLKNDSLLVLTLQMPLKKVLSDIGKNNVWHEAVLIWNGKKIKTKVKTRGNFRRNPENCNFPPLFLTTDSAESQKTPFEGVKRLVLVSHCQNEKAEYEHYVAEEYAIYKTYELFSDKSFGARLAKIRYQDSQNAEYFIEKLAFFTESFADIEKRLNGKLLSEKDSINYYRCNSFLMTQAAVFEFFIGNTDWSVSNKHNIEVMKTASGELLPLIYDFDMSGIIDAEYAGTDTDLGISGVSERVYRGYCISNSELPLVFEEFEKKKSAIENIWKNLHGQSPERKQRSLKYIQEFYNIIQNKDSVAKHFEKNCR